MTRTLWTDIETYSEVSIRDGTDNYSRAAEIMLWAYAVDDAPVRVWDVTAGEAMPRELREALVDESTLVVAHNAAFEASVFLHSGHSITPSRYRCTMAQALAHGLPGALDKLCEIFGIGEDKAKLKDGNQLVQLFCKPQPKGRKLRRATRTTHPTEWARFIQYCGNDVEAMRAIARKMPNWNYQGDELALWHLDQRINQRGAHVDLDLVEAAIATAERVKAQLAGRAQEITDGEVAATTQRDKLLLHIAESYDIILPDLRGSTLERLLKSDADMPPVLRELFENRLAASSTSVSKYKRFAQLTGPDGMLRNTLQFCGASRTGRWCLAEGAPVLVLTEGGEVMEKPIETVSARDLVWDGVEWVAHQGLVFQGYKEVIEWDGVTATPDHEVYLSDTRSVTLAEAKEKGLRLWRGISRCEQRRPAGNSAAMLVRTYDLMNAGPRHRFTAYGRVVSNCGRGVQLQNLPRPTMKQKAIDAGIKMLKADCVDLLYDNPMEVMQSTVRGCIIAPPDKKLVVADLSNIEGRMLVWLSGEQWKLDAFAAFDTCLGADGAWYGGDVIRDAALAGQPIALRYDKKGEPIRKGHDLYALAYAKSFNITPEAVMENKESGDGSMRQIGKCLELSMGYGGGVGAFMTFALAYGVDLNGMADKAVSTIPARIWLETDKAWKWATERGNTHGLSEQTWRVCDSFKRLWREAHPETVKFWWEVDAAMRGAIMTPGKAFIARRVEVKKTKAWLRIVLPSGRSLCYPSPKIDEDDSLSYMGINQYNRKWQRIRTYGPKGVENITQAASRDVIAHNLPHVEAAGYEVLVTVHDEDITAAPDTGEYNADHLAAIMATNPPWAKGLPLAAAGFEAYRYRKG